MSFQGIWKIMGICNVTDDSKRHKCHTHLEEGKEGVSRELQALSASFQSPG